MSSADGPAPDPNRPSAPDAIDAEQVIRVQTPSLPVAWNVWGPEQVSGRGDREIARVASAQKGFMLREQLLEAGLGRGAIVHRLQTGRLRAYYRNVYLVDRAVPEPLGEEMAAVLHFGGRAFLSHWTAASLWGLIDEVPDDVSLTLVDADSRMRAGLRIFRASACDSGDLRRRHGLPVTSPARTIIDLARCVSSGALEQMIAEAQAHRLLRAGELERALSQLALRQRPARLTRLLAGDAERGVARSKAERQLRRLLRLSGLPAPLVNPWLHGYLVDFYWPDHKLVVEMDGFGSHGSRPMFESDRRRDQVLSAAGIQVLRVTWLQLEEEPIAVVVRIAQALALRTPAGARS